MKIIGSMLLSLTLTLTFACSDDTGPTADSGGKDMAPPAEAGGDVGTSDQRKPDQAQAQKDIAVADLAKPDLAKPDLAIPDQMQPDAPPPSGRAGPCPERTWHWLQACAGGGDREVR